MSEGTTAILSAAIAAAITAAALILQTALVNRADSKKRLESQRTDRERKRRELTQRYLFQLLDATESLRRRLENWAHHGGQPWSESVDPGYWDATTIYAFGRALAAERILSLDGAYAAIHELFPSLSEALQPLTIDRAIQKNLQFLFYYHRMALAESLLDARTDSCRLLMYTEWRQRYNDPSAGLSQLLEPTKASLQDLNPQHDLDELSVTLASISSQISTAMTPPS